MSRVEAVSPPSVYRTVSSYIDVLKPRETVLLTFIGLCAAFAAADGSPSLGKLALACIAIMIGSGGVNGLTNYLDRNLDARMKRTCGRALPSRRINPPEKMLPWAGGLVILGLALAWFLNPICVLVGAVGTIVAITYRKRVSCAFPQGTVAGCAPVLIGWLTFNTELSLGIVFLGILIGVWIPLHVWSVMVARRHEYIAARITYFPINWEAKDAAKVLLGLAVVLYAASLALYFAMDLGPLFLVAANVLGIMMLVGSIRLVVSKVSDDAWKLYKLSSFPYLGLIFLAMCLDLWLFR